MNYKFNDIFVRIGYNIDNDNDLGGGIMCVVSINVPEEILLDLHEDKNDFAEYIKRMLALDLYKNKKVSLGYCANVAEMSKEEFVRFLGTNGDGRCISRMDSCDENRKPDGKIDV